MKLDVNYKNYGEFYEIDESGNVWSKPRTVYRNDGVVLKRNAHKLSWSYNSDGYPFVKLCVNGKEERIAVHRLVALTFVPNPFGRTEVNHIDCNRQNPFVTNLEWVTHADNISHSHRLGRYEKPQFEGGLNPKARPVVIEDLNERFECIKHCAEFLITRGETYGSIQNATSQIIKVCNGTLKHYLGHVYKYA